MTRVQWLDAFVMEMSRRQAPIAPAEALDLAVQAYEVVPDEDPREIALVELCMLPPQEA